VSNTKKYEKVSHCLVAVSDHTRKTSKPTMRLDFFSNKASKRSTRLLSVRIKYSMCDLICVCKAMIMIKSQTPE